MKSIKCKFCHGEAVYSPIEDLKQHAINIFFCDTCRAEYLAFPDSRISSVSIYTEINNKMYRWTTTSNNRGTLSIIKNPGIPSNRKNEGVIYVLSFNNILPNTVTPDNIQQKIKAWLIFQ